MEQFTTPQPVGIFPLPASYLIIPQIADADIVAAELMQGRLPEIMPESLQFFTQALAGDIAAAHSQLENDDSLIGQYNRFVLQSDPAQYQQLRAKLSGELQQMLDMVAYTLGYIPAPPERGETQDERLALVLMAQATYALEQGRADQAIPLLEEAIKLAKPVSPMFAAQLLATLAETKFTYQGSDPFIIQHYQEALKLMEPSDLAETKAEIALNLGIVYHDMSNGGRGALLEAVNCYQKALAVFTREGHPEPYALAQSNLALAYLSMPMQEAGDQLRMAIAVQSLREALKVYTRETHPDQWASAQLNLANAYQYLPSAHPQDNLAEAVQLYEEVLEARDRNSDPLGFARVLANQGNALAHLGIFVHAIPKLQEAQTIFETHGDGEAAHSVADLIAQIQAKEVETMQEKIGD